MTECSNVEVRELLPDYLHESLGTVARERVKAHLSSCADCRNELETLRVARTVLSAVPTPRVDVAAIARALPLPSSHVRGAPRHETKRDTRPLTLSRPVARRSTAMLRLAAAITFVALGGISVAITRAYFGDPTLPAGASTAVISPDTPTVAALLPTDSPVAGERSAAGLTLHAAWRELDDDALESLMGALEDLEAAPLAEPETTPGGRTLDGALSGS